MAEPERWQVSTDAAEVYESCLVPAIFVASLVEMWRTLAPGGRLAIAAWAPIYHARGYQILVDLALRLCGREAADVLAAPFVLGNQVEFAKLLVNGGIPGATVTLHEGSIRFPSVKEFIRIEVKGSALADMLSDDMMQTLAGESEDALVEFVVPSGESSCRWTHTSQPQAKARSRWSRMKGPLHACH